MAAILMISWGHATELIDGSIITNRVINAGDRVVLRAVSEKRYKIVGIRKRMLSDTEDSIFQFQLKNGTNLISGNIKSTEQESIRVYYDKTSFPRYHYSISDALRVLQEIESKGYENIFEHQLFGFLKHLHESYGTKVTLFLFYKDASFDLTSMSEKYKEEFIENSDWLRFGFHAIDGRSYPYAKSGYVKAKRDYLKIKNEVVRYAGEESWSNVVRSGYCSGSNEAVAAWRDCGVSLLLTCRPITGLYYFGGGDSWLGILWDKIRRMGKLDEVYKYIFNNDYWIDYDRSIAFVTLDVLIEKERDVTGKLGQIYKYRNRAEIIDVAVHEYALRDEVNRRRSEEAICWLKEKGYVPVFYTGGFLGNKNNKESFLLWEN